MRVYVYVLLLAIMLGILTDISECRQKRPGRKRARPPGPPGSKPRAKRPRFSLFKGRNPKPRIPPGVKDMDNQESKVHYYSLPRKPTHRPRIILGDELNFNEMGIQESEKQAQRFSGSSISPRPVPTTYLDDQETLLDIPSNDKPVQKHYPRGPGYRLKGSLSDHYVLAQEYVPKKPRHPPVMSSVKRAAAELRNAYASALIQSAKVAKFTTHVASSYFKGVRNIFLSDPESAPRKPGYRGRVDEHVLEQPESLTLAPTSVEEAPTLMKVEATDNESVDKLLPNVYLDWGGSFWKLFYKNSHVPAS